ncbi:outer membrane protein [Salinarimonas soli]|uniref:Porin family protein n=1 Tax=Salinarimonas soli TaxID=1638099 RepID=A0A5B2VDD1_9HYPH|nr:outer membrane beta-barrel protein [Salinarimonas soli]KAA2236748.1 porin family protein [Salinarimonas soli]
MGSLKVLAVAGLVAAASTAASAADLLPPPPAVYAPEAPAPVEIGGGWYLRGDIGVGVTHMRDFEYVSDQPLPTDIAYSIDRKSVNDQVFVGAGIGFQFNSWLRADVTGEYRASTGFDAMERARYTFGGADGFNHFTGKIASFVVLANLYADLGTWYGITPFVGVGVGGAHHRTQDFQDIGYGRHLGGIGFAGSTSSTHLAFALHAGLAYDVNERLKLELAYRYLNMGRPNAGTINCEGGCDAYGYKLKDYDSHDIKIGMRWLLASPAPVAYERPLIRKY